MDEQVKKRLVGAAVLVSLAVIFVPMLFDDAARIEAPVFPSRIPEPPAPDSTPFSSAHVAETTLPALPEPEPEPSPEPLPASPPAKQSAPAAAPPAVKGTPEKGVPATGIGLRAWVIQVGSFSDRGNAMEVVKKLRAAGFDTLIEEAQVSGKTVFRVRVGPEADRVRAQALLPQIKATVGLDGSIRRYP